MTHKYTCTVIDFHNHIHIIDCDEHRIDSMPVMFYNLKSENEFVPLASFNNCTSILIQENEEYVEPYTPKEIDEDRIKRIEELKVKREAQEDRDRKDKEEAEIRNLKKDIEHQQNLKVIQLEAENNA